MTDYISEYTGEEIDAGIAKANTALQSYEYLNSVIEQAFDEITDEDTEITLNNTIQAKMKMELKGNTEQNGTPTPDSPIDVRVVTGNNSVKVVGKNLLNTNLMIEFTPNNTSWWSLDGKGQFYNATNIAISNLYYDLKANTTYTFSVYQHKNISTSVTSPIQLVNPNGNVVSSMKLSDEGLKKTFTTTDAIRIYPRITPNEANVLTQCIVQLEEGSTATTYEPYQSQTYPINLGTMELCKIGTYQDYIYKDSGKWYKHSEICKVVLDGSEDWEYQSQFPRFRMSNLSPRPVNISDLFCTHYKLGQTSDTNNTISLPSGTGYSQVLIHDERFTTKETFNSWLQSNNVTIYYRLETPTNTEITDTTLISQLNAIENAMSYKTQTNISQTNANLPFILYASALGKLSS